MARGRQLKVYLHPDDRPAVDEFVQGELASVLLTERSPSSNAFEAQDSQGEGMGRLICPKSLVAELNPRFVEARGEWLLDVQSSPLIEWWFSKLDGGLLYPGRFYYVPSLPATGAAPHKPAVFLETATRLFKWVRAKTAAVTTEWGSERLGPVAAELLRDGQISLRMNPPGSRI